MVSDIHSFISAAPSLWLLFVITSVHFLCPLDALSLWFSLCDMALAVPAVKQTKQEGESEVSESLLT